MGKVYQRGKIYYLDLCHDGKRIRKRASHSKKIAELMLSELELKKAKEQSGIFVKDIQLSQFVDKLKSYNEANHRPRTTARYNFLIDFFNEYARSKRLSKLSHIRPDTIEGFKIHRLTRAKEGTINRELKMLKSFFNLAIDWGYLSKNPVERIRPFPEMKKRIPRFFSEHEALTIIQNAPQPYRDVFLILLYTGMRRDELRLISVEQIDLTRRKILVIETPIFKPKTYEERAIPISDTIYPILEERLTERRSGLLFSTKNGTPYPESYWWKRLKKVVEEINKNQDIKIQNATIHTFRHTFASWLIMSGVDIRTVSHLLGHANIETTMIYSHLSKTHVEAAISRIPSVTNMSQIQNQK